VKHATLLWKPLFWRRDVPSQTRTSIARKCVARRAVMMTQRPVLSITPMTVGASYRERRRLARRRVAASAGRRQHGALARWPLAGDKTASSSPAANEARQARRPPARSDMKSFLQLTLGGDGAILAAGPPASGREDASSSAKSHLLRR